MARVHKVPNYVARGLRCSACVRCAEAATASSDVVSDSSNDGSSASSDDPDLDTEGRQPEAELATRAQWYRLLLWHWVREGKFMERRLGHITDPAQLVTAVYFFAVHGQKCAPLVEATEARLVAALGAVSSGKSPSLKAEYVG